MRTGDLLRRAVLVQEPARIPAIRRAPSPFQLSYPARKSSQAALRHDTYGTQLAPALARLLLTVHLSNTRLSDLQGYRENIATASFAECNAEPNFAAAGNWA